MSEQNKLPELRSYFKISEDEYGFGFVFRVKFKTGNHTDVTYQYDHDAVYDNAIGHLETLLSWIDDQHDTCTDEIPRYARHFVKVVEK